MAPLQGQLPQQHAAISWHPNSVHRSTVGGQRQPTGGPRAQSRGHQNFLVAARPLSGQGASNQGQFLELVDAVTVCFPNTHPTPACPMPWAAKTSSSPYGLQQSSLHQFRCCQHSQLLVLLKTGPPPLYCRRVCWSLLAAPPVCQQQWQPL
jgi:hypothetical protein